MGDEDQTTFRRAYLSPPDPEDGAPGSDSSAVHLFLVTEAPHPTLVSATWEPTLMAPIRLDVPALREVESPADAMFGGLRCWCGELRLPNGEGALGLAVNLSWTAGGGGLRDVANFALIRREPGAGQRLALFVVASSNLAPSRAPSRVSYWREAHASLLHAILRNEGGLGRRLVLHSQLLAFLCTPAREYLRDDGSFAEFALELASKVYAAVAASRGDAESGAASGAASAEAATELVWLSGVLGQLSSTLRRKATLQLPPDVWARVASLRAWDGGVREAARCLVAELWGGAAGASADADAPCARESVVFRALRHDDIAALKALQLELFPVRYQNSFYARLLSYGYYTQVGFNRAGELVAVASARVVDDYEQALASRAAYIMTLGVKAGHRRGGLGTWIMHRILDILRDEAGCRAAYLHVKTLNDAAVAFYQRLGFTIPPGDAGYSENHYSIDGEQCVGMRAIPP